MQTQKINLIFLHGGPGFKDYLKPYFSQLSDQFNCVFYDQVQGQKITLNDMLTQLNDVVGSLTGDTILIGHSWGGVLAVEYVLANSHKISALVLMNTGLCHQHWGEEYHKELESLGLEDASMEEIFLAQDEHEAGATLMQATGDTFSEETFASLQVYLKQYDVRERIKSLNIPIINIFGEKDVRFPARVARTFATYNHRIKNVEIKGGGHFPFLTQERRKQIYDAIRLLNLSH